MAKRNPYSRWRRLPPVFRSGQHKLPDPGEDPQRIIIYLPSAVLDQAETLAVKAGVPTIQEYCSKLLGAAIEVERVKAHLVEVEEKRGPMEGFKEVTDDPSYLTEWHERSGSREIEPAQPPAVDPPASEAVSAVRFLEDETTKPTDHPAPGPEPGDMTGRVVVRIEPARWTVEPVITERIVPEVLDGAATEAVLFHVGTDAQQPGAFLPSLRRGQPPSPAGISELMAALQQVEADQRGVSMLERKLAYALYRLALESQVLITEVWPRAFDDRTLSAIRAVQEMVERILSGQEIRYYENPGNRAAENSS